MPKRSDDHIYAEQEAVRPPWAGTYKSPTMQEKLRQASHDDNITVWKCQNLLSEAADAIDGDEDEIRILKAEIAALEAGEEEECR